jgi:hypothetical protein
MRSPVKVSLSAVSVSAWIPLDYVARTFNVGLFASLSEDASSAATYSVEYTPDNPNQSNGTRNNVASLTRSGTTATLTFSKPHGLVSNDAVKVWNSGDPNLDGDYTATVTSATALTYVVGNTGAAVGSVYTAAVGLRVFEVATAMTAATTRQAASLTTPCWAVRLNATAITAGSITLEVIQGLARG